MRKAPPRPASPPGPELVPADVLRHPRAFARSLRRHRGARRARRRRGALATEIVGVRRQLDDESAANAALCERLDALQRRKEYGGPPTAQAAAAAYRAKELENLLALRDKQLISVLAQQRPTTAPDLAAHLAAAAAAGPRPLTPVPSSRSAGRRRRPGSSSPSPPPPSAAAARPPPPRPPPTAPRRWRRRRRPAGARAAGASARWPPSPAAARRRAWRRRRPPPPPPAATTTRRRSPRVLIDGDGTAGDLRAGRHGACGDAGAWCDARPLGVGAEQAPPCARQAVGRTGGAGRRRRRRAAAQGGRRPPLAAARVAVAARARPQARAAVEFAARRAVGVGAPRRRRRRRPDALGDRRRAVAGAAAGDAREARGRGGGARTEQGLDAVRASVAQRMHALGLQRAADGETLRVGLFVTTPESRPRSAAPARARRRGRGRRTCRSAPPPPGTTFAPGSRSIVMPLAGGP